MTLNGDSSSTVTTGKYYLCPEQTLFCEFFKHIGKTIDTNIKQKRTQDGIL